MQVQLFKVLVHITVKISKVSTKALEDYQRSSEVFWRWSKFTWGLQKTAKLKVISRFLNTNPRIVWTLSRINEYHLNISKHLQESLKPFQRFQRSPRTTQATWPKNFGTLLYVLQIFSVFFFCIGIVQAHCNLPAETVCTKTLHNICFQVYIINK